MPPNHPTLADLANQLARHASPPSSPLPSQKRASVLVCLFEGDGGADDIRVLLTKRSSGLSMNPGDVSLPGGKFEEGDRSDADTAKREAKEEIGLDPSLVKVVKVLQHFHTKRGMRVVPVVGILADRRSFVPAPNPSEVEAVFDVPLKMFLGDEKRREEEKEWMGDKYVLHYFDYETGGDKYVIWALTAGILIETATLLYQRPPEFEVRKPSFWKR